MTNQEPRGQELIDRYKANYHISDNAPLTEEMILQHWELEKSLTKQLLESNKVNRWEIFDQCYSKLYFELEWINRYIDSVSITNFSDKKFEFWKVLVGKPPQSIYEIGS